MLPDGAIAVDQVWKRFRSDRFRQRRARDLIERSTLRLLGRRGPNPWRWVLKDIGFAAEPGESIGIVGVNGSGKSTLLKIISGVMFPHSGRVERGGRVGALIEVVSGIHPDLSGRENAYVYGSLLGLDRSYISRRFDEIVAFAELEEAIDRKVKYYSSGMKMRIGFAIAAFLEPDILIVDEVLAVGDSSFQQKCLGRMREVLNSGATLLLVSHDLASVGAIAQRGLWLHDGRIRNDGPIDETLNAYRRSIESQAEANAQMRGRMTLSDISVEGPEGALAVTNGPCAIRFKVNADSDTNAILYLGISQGAATPIFVLRNETRFGQGTTPMELHIPRLPLPAGDYFLWFAAERGWKDELSPWQPVGTMHVVGMRLDPAPRGVVRLAPTYVEATWSRQ